ncbi:MAG: DUF4339 domain-containing protein [Proteobacteria bacterium]|nr:DUF4339 domain-containing protein [Pseudomonadota bacterium]
MNTENEKKWFVYVGDHHEGPLSVREVFDRKQQGQVTLESYVWCEGMADWLMLHQVPDLEGELSAHAPAAAATSAAETASESVTASPETPEAGSAPAGVAQESSATTAFDEDKPAQSKNTTRVETLSPGVQAAVSVQAASQAGSKAKKNPGIMKGLAIATGVAVLIFVGALVGVSRSSNTSLHARFRPLLVSITTKAPLLKKAIKLVPRLADVKAQELSELDTARAASLESGGTIGLALSNSDPNRPLFYVSSNLPGEARLTLLVIGEPETLLNRLQYSGQVNVTLSHGFTKSDVLLMDGGQPLPKGDYRVYAFDSAEQKDEATKSALATLNEPRQGAKVVAVHKFFIGGERDQTYLTRLKSFHENIRKKADRELEELHQFAETLILQHNALTSGFQKMYKAKKISPAMKSAWKRDSAAWLQISGQLDQTIQTWSKDTLQNEFFYGKAYELVKNAFQSMRALFQLEIDFVEKNTDRNAFEIQHGKLLSEARDSLDLMRTRTEALFKAPKTQSGLPSREGL